MLIIFKYISVLSLVVSYEEVVKVGPIEDDMSDVHGDDIALNFIGVRGHLNRD